MPASLVSVPRHRGIHQTVLARCQGALRSSSNLYAGKRGEPFVLDGAPHREVVKALPVARSDAEHIVNGVIEVAADPRRANPRLFSFEVQHLADETGLPEEISIEPTPVGPQPAHVISPHPRAQ